MRAAAAAGVTRDMGKQAQARQTAQWFLGQAHACDTLASKSRPGVGSQPTGHQGWRAGTVASSSPHMCVPNGQRYQVTWVHVYVHALQDDKTRRNALCWQRT